MARHRHQLRREWRFAPYPGPGEWHGVWTYHEVKVCDCGHVALCEIANGHPEPQERARRALAPVASPRSERSSE